MNSNRALDEIQVTVSYIRAILVAVVRVLCKEDYLKNLDWA